VDAARRVWAEALAAAPSDGAPLWLHGDPHPANLVVAPGDGHDGADRLAAVVDFGDVTAGDPASDLGVLWLNFDAAGRATCRAALAAAGAGPGGRGWDDATWARARGWALLYATNMLAHPEEHPAMVPIGEHALAALLEGR
jgi:aminoglycoside phosphotransferase (APT) family kinase protein